ncbi:MAG: hypothetical protein QG620_796 [Patescibacteria group bacterium]|nr:hypothetical protein [Patescibacteria group bacterium]
MPKIITRGILVGLILWAVCMLPVVVVFYNEIFKSRFFEEMAVFPIYIIFLFTCYFNIAVLHGRDWSKMEIPEMCSGDKIFYIFFFNSYIVCYTGNSCKRIRPVVSARL